MVKLFLPAILLAAGLAAAGCALTGSSPPITPHPATGQYQECASCHESGAGGAPVTDHPRKNDCLSCHPARQETGTAGTAEGGTAGQGGAAGQNDAASQGGATGASSGAVDASGGTTTQPAPGGSR